jgi:hypothetical protein
MEFISFSNEGPSVDISTMLLRVRKTSPFIEYESLKRITNLRNSFESKCYNILQMNAPAETFNRWYIPKLFYSYF